MSTSRLPWLVRSMHTAGRRVAHPPLGGAGAKGPGGSNIPTPQESVPHPPAPHSEAGPINANTLPPLDPLDPNAATPPSGASASFHNGNSAESSSESTSTTETPRMFNRKGQEIKIRPHRQTSVQLPSGHLEPTSWPPGEEYENSPVAAETQPEHPLWQFFHVSRGAMHKPKSNQQQPPEIGAIETSAPDWTIENDNSRGWTAPELRLKSFAELHTLWYILLKEKNVLATQKEERRRLSSSRGMHDKIWQGVRSQKVRKSMARIKWVLQERRMGLIATLGPKIDEDNAPLRPASWSDPANQYDAIRGQAKYEDVRLPKALRRISTRDQAKMPQREQEQREDRDATVGDEEVSETEVESRDGGYAGKEAEDFVKETEIDEDGRVRKV